MCPPSVRGLRIGYRCLGVLRAFLELFCHHLTDLHHHTRQFILTPARDLPRCRPHWILSPAEAVPSYPALSRSVPSKPVLWAFPGVCIPPYTGLYQPVLAFWLAAG